MSLRNEAIDVMYEADGERVGERVYVAKALDALLDWLCDNADQFAGPNLAPADQVRVIADLLSEEER